jgi:hypothetical protein
MPALKPTIREGIEVADFGDELVVCQPVLEASFFHYLNESAALVFRLCDGTGTVTELAADIADVYGLPIEEVEPQVRAIVREFRRNGMLTAKPVVRRAREQNEHDHHDHSHDHNGASHEHHDHSPDGHGLPDERQRIRREVPHNE